MSADLYAAFMAAGANESEAPNGFSTETDNQTTTTRLPAVELDLPASDQVWGTSHQESRKKEPATLWRRDLDGTDVLFDAEEPDEDDDFGDFETVGNANEGEPRVNTNLHGNIQPLVPDLLGEEDYAHQASITSSKQPIGTETVYATQFGHQEKGKIQSSWDDDWGEFEQTGRGNERISEQPKDQNGIDPNPAGDSITSVPEDDWEPCEDGTSAPVQSSVASQTSETTTTKSQLTQAFTSQAPTTAPAFERPTNIPPPSSLLQLLSSVFETVHNDNALQSKPKSELAAQVMVVYRTACRLVAGRTMRWKRDTILAQSVRVGQAGKSDGMKLASLNKNESTKEQRDSEEMIHDWSNYVHEFKSILAQARLQPHRLRISASPSTQTLKYSGTSESSKQCALCGLKRTERLSEVDTDAEDIFGEFWTEHWGHKDCYNFWYTYKDLLSHR